MYLIVRTLTILIALASVAFSVSAGTYIKRTGFEFQADPNAITILFVNGIKNTTPQTEKSSEALIQSLRASGLPQLTYNFSYFYNPTDGFLGDSAEVIQQAKISDLFLGTSGGVRSVYYKSLGDYYNSQYAIVGTLTGIQKRVVTVAGRLKKNIEYILTISSGLVIVPHSQGNLYVEAAYSMLQAEGKTALLSKIRVAGVASAAATTPSDRYITHTSDKVISSEYAITHDATGQLGIYLNNYKPLDFNQTACQSVLQVLLYCGSQILWTAIDISAHGFQEIYLNSQLTSQSSGLTFPKIIYDFVSASLGEIHAASSGTGTPSLVASGFNLIDAIASDGTYIYVGTDDGKLFRMSKTGTDVRNIANVSGFIDAIVFNNGNIYFDGKPFNFGAGSIYRMPQDLSATPTVFLSGVIKLLGISGSTVYYWDGDSGLKSIPIGGGTPDVLIQSISLQQFVVDGSSIFFNDFRNAVFRLDVPTKTISTVIPQVVGGGLVGDANNVYSGWPTIVQAPKQGGTVIPLVTLGAADAGHTPLLSDGNFVYYIEGPGGTGLTDTLKAVPVGGGTPIPLSSTLISARYMINVNGTLYWSTAADAPGAGAIYRLVR